MRKHYLIIGIISCIHYLTVLIPLCYVVTLYLYQQQVKININEHVDVFKEYVGMHIFMGFIFGLGGIVYIVNLMFAINLYSITPSEGEPTPNRRILIYSILNLSLITWMAATKAYYVSKGGEDV